MEGELDGLDVIIVDDDPIVVETIGRMVEKFYTYGDVYKFTDAETARNFCMDRDHGIAIFVVDVYLAGKTGFAFLESVSNRYRSVYEDAIIITGDASDDVVNMCLDSDVNYLLEKPIRLYALQLAVRSIATKYLRFAETIQKDPEFARWVNTISRRYFAQMPRLSKR